MSSAALMIMLGVISDMIVLICFALIGNNEMIKAKELKVRVLLTKSDSVEGLFFSSCNSRAVYHAVQAYPEHPAHAAPPVPSMTPFCVTGGEVCDSRSIED